MDNPTELLTAATFLSALGFIVLMTIKQLAPSLIKRIQSRWDTNVKEEQTKAATEAAEDKLSIEAKSFLTEAAKDHLDTIRNMAQECQDEVKALRKEILESKIERASLQAKDEVRIEEIQRIRNDYIEAKGNLNQAKSESEAAKNLVTKLQEEMSGLRQEVDRMHNQISVFETRLMSEQQNTRIIEKRLEAAEAEIKLKDGLLKESQMRNDKLSQDIKDLQRKLREYAAKLHVVENNMETSIADKVDTKELIAREYDDFSVTTQVSKTDDVKAAITKSLEDIKVENETRLLEKINSVGDVSDDSKNESSSGLPKEYRKPITKKIPQVETSGNTTEVDTPTVSVDPVKEEVKTDTKDVVKTDEIDTSKDNTPKDKKKSPPKE